MKKINLTIRVALFALILSLGTVAALLVGETRGLALTDFSDTPVRAMTTASDGATLYAAMDGGQQAAGIYRSEDNGLTWQWVSVGPGIAVNTLVTHPINDDILYAGTVGGLTTSAESLWRSYDGGRTWHKSLLGLPTNAQGLVPAVSALAVDPQQPGVLYVGTDGQGVYRFDADLNRYGYESIGGLALYRAHVKSLVVGPEGRVYALTNEGLFVSDGKDWQQVTLPEMAVSLAVAPGDSGTLYAGGVSTGIFRSTDGGQTWKQANNGLEMIPGAALRVTALAVDETNPRRVVAATTYGMGNRFGPGSIYESSDGGHSWAKVANTETVVMELTLDQKGIYAATETGLVFYGEQAETKSALPQLRSLTELSRIQILILTLTAALAGLALVGRSEWVLNRKARSTPS